MVSQYPVLADSLSAPAVNAPINKTGNNKTSPSPDNDPSGFESQLLETTRSSDTPATDTNQTSGNTAASAPVDAAVPAIKPEVQTRKPTEPAAAKTPPTDDLLAIMQAPEAKQPAGNTDQAPSDLASILASKQARTQDIILPATAPSLDPAPAEQIVIADKDAAVTPVMPANPMPNAAALVDIATPTDAPSAPVLEQDAAAAAIIAKTMSAPATGLNNEKVLEQTVAAAKTAPAIASGEVAGSETLKPSLAKGPSETIKPVAPATANTVEGAPVKLQGSQQVSTAAGESQTKEIQSAHDAAARVQPVQHAVNAESVQTEQVVPEDGEQATIRNIEPATKPEIEQDGVDPAKQRDPQIAAAVTSATPSSEGVEPTDQLQPTPASVRNQPVGEAVVEEITQTPEKGLSATINAENPEVPSKPVAQLNVVPDTAAEVMPAVKDESPVRSIPANQTSANQVSAAGETGEIQTANSVQPKQAGAIPEALARQSASPVATAPANQTDPAQPPAIEEAAAPVKSDASETIEVATKDSRTAASAAPKGDTFSKMMADLQASQAFKDVAMQTDDGVKSEGMAPIQTEASSIRLTGIEAFGRTGQVPTQAAVANAQAIAAQISKFASKGETRFEIRLDPAELGKVDVRLTIGSDGQTRAHLFVEKSETLDFLMRDQRMLERSLTQSGLNLDKQGLEFSMMDQKDQGQQNAFQGNGGTEQQAGERDLTMTDEQQATATQPHPVNQYVASNGINLVI